MRVLLWKILRNLNQLFFWQDGISERGRILDLNINETGMKVYVENLRTHEMIILTAERVYREKDCK